MSISNIRSFIRQRLKYVYKRGLWRVITSKTSQFLYLQTLYSIRAFLSIFNNKILINCNESSFSRSFISWYSLLPYSQNHNILNDRWRERASLIMSIWSTGQWGALIVIKTVKKVEFWSYFIILKKFNELWMHVDWNNIELWVNNATIHSLKMTKTFAYLLGLKLSFIPSYSLIFSLLLTNLQVSNYFELYSP